MRFLGNLMTIKHGLGSDDAATFIEADLLGDHAPPLHVHRHEDESFYVLAGSVRFRCGEDEFEAVAGDYVFVRRGVEHAFRVASGGARTIMVTGSSMLARFMAAGGRPADGECAVAPSAEEMARVVELAPAYDMTVVGPPLA